MNPEIAEKIEQYLNNEMSPTGRNDFELQLSTDAELAAAFELYKTIDATMSPSQNENELRQTLQKMNSKYFASSAKVRSMSFKKWMAVAASLTIIAVVCFYLLMPSGSSTEKLYAEYARHQPVNIQSRGNATDTLAQQASSEFNKKDYKKALPLMEAYLKQQPGNIQMKFALAICYLETNNFTGATNIFSEISSGQTAYAEAGKWYLALSALKQNNIQACRNYLNDIPTSSSYYPNAKELFNKLPH